MITLKHNKTEGHISSAVFDFFKAEIMKLVFTEGIFPGL